MVSLRYRVPPGTVRLDIEPCLVRGRRIDLDMTFRNLLDNSVKYAGPVPQVNVAVQAGRGGGRRGESVRQWARHPPAVAAEDLRPFRPHRPRSSSETSPAPGWDCTLCACSSPAPRHDPRGRPTRRPGRNV